MGVYVQAKMINANAGAWAGGSALSETAYVLFHIDRYLLRWARRKYKYPRGAPRRTWRTLAAIKSGPGLFDHWRWELRTRIVTARAGLIGVR